MGNESIDLSLVNIWRSWYRFRRGKKVTIELDKFQYKLEENLTRLYLDLNSGLYKHGGYQQFTICDNKRRQISVASIRDRVVHRLIYDYLVAIYDSHFIFDAWSCRKGKGLLKAIERTQYLLQGNKNGWVWRADITKFFDSVDHQLLKSILKRRVQDVKLLRLLDEVINSYSTLSLSQSPIKIYKGLPIGNLTSQIFANIYLNELDRFISHNIKPKGYVRYGDDFLVMMSSCNELLKSQVEIQKFIVGQLYLKINIKQNIIVKASRGAHFLGVNIYPNKRELFARNKWRSFNLINSRNVASYRDLIQKHGGIEMLHIFD